MSNINLGLSRRWVAALVAVAAVAAVTSCQINNPVSVLHPKKDRYPVKVRTMVVSTASSICRNTYMGEVVPAKSVTLTAPYPGTLKTVNVTKGSMVEQGSVLAVISSQSVESAFRIAEANLSQARDGFERVQKVYSSGSITEVQMMDIRTKLDKAEASMASAAKAVADGSLKAPYRCVVSDVFPSVGEEVAISSRILTLLDISDLRINISVHENEINSLKNGSKATVDVPALGIEGAAARVVEKSLLSSSLTHSYICALRFASAPKGLMPGMAVKVRFESTSDDDTIVIPASAVQLDSHGRYVWISDDSCTVHKRRVAIDGYSGKGVIVAEGLQPGDKVITEGYQKVSGGMKVTE